MNRGGHVAIGLIGIGIVIFLLTGFKVNVEVNALFIIAIVSVCGSMLPDIFEPAKHWTHRKKFHSKKTMYLMGKASVILFIPIGIQVLIGFGVNITFVIFAFPFSYFLHLVADSTTPAGLPDK